MGDFNTKCFGQLENVRDVAEEIVSRTKHDIRTHSVECHKYHLECFALFFLGCMPAGSLRGKFVEGKESLTHFSENVEKQYFGLQNQISAPPEGWYKFGTHSGKGFGLIFWGTDESGMPIWESPVDSYYPRYGEVMTGWSRQFLWLPRLTVDSGWLWLKKVYRRRVRRLRHISGGPEFWFQYAERIPPLFFDSIIKSAKIESL
jgi:hypothetical protein